MLAQLGYLPLKWTPQNATAMQPDNVATELAAVYTPPAGTFTWKRGYPSDPDQLLGRPVQPDHAGRDPGLPVRPRA